MLGLRLLRMFSSFTPASSLFSQDAAVSFLRNPNNYIDSNIDVIQTSVEVLKQDLKSLPKISDINKTFNILSVHLRGLVRKMSPTQTAAFIDGLRMIGMIDQSLFNSFDNHVIRNFRNMTSLELATVCDACISSKDNIELWKMLEEVTLTLLESNSEFSDASLSIILKIFSQRNNSPYLISRIREKIISVLDRMGPKEYASIMNSLTLSKNMTPDMMAALTKSYEHVKVSMSGNSISTTLNCFIKNIGPAEIIEELEQSFINEITSMTLASLSFTINTYHLAYSTEVMKYPKKVELIKAIREVFITDDLRLCNYLSQERVSDFKLTIWFGLGKMNLLKHKKEMKHFLTTPRLNERNTKGVKKEMLRYLQMFSTR